MSNSSVRSILDMPHEILVMIILHINVRERLALANSCKKFNDLVFGDEELLRNLDFTEERQLTRASDIQQYFNNENTYKKIRGINTENVWEVSSLTSSIGKAINLVELNTLNGLKFESVEELSSFLKPLVHLKRLSIDWPDLTMTGLEDYDIHNWNQLFEEPLSRLTYLSLKMKRYTKQFAFILQLCQQLEELCISVSKKVDDYESPLRQQPRKLSSLKFVRLIASINSGLLRRHIMHIVPDSADWTDYYLGELDVEICLVRNVDVCPELSRVKEMPLLGYAEHYRQTNSIGEGCTLVSENLLNAVIRITHNDAPNKFCCLSLPESPFIQPCQLKISEAKKLLKDPGYQISCLELYHVIERNCDAHLVASAFPNLTKLVLFRIAMLAPEGTKPLRKRLRKKGSMLSEENSDASNTDSSFKMLVANTPRLKVLRISPEDWKDNEDYWDLDALDLISGWKNLTTLELSDIPIQNVKFLIDIGKKCEQLEELLLTNVGHNRSYESELLQMLHSCKKLKKLTIYGMGVRYLSKMFDILSHHSRLEYLHLGNEIEEYNFVELVSAFERMLKNCKKLNKFSYDLSPLQTGELLGLAMERIVEELNRPNFKFTYCYN